MFRKFGAYLNPDAAPRPASPFCFAPHSPRRNMVCMALRRILASALALLWLCVPLLACLPNGSMTAEEMACCQKMAGNCAMGGGNHKCCDTAINHTALAALQAATFDLHVFQVAAPLAWLVAPALPASRGIDSPFVAPSPPSLALSSVLRI